ncbi:MAG: hypothetical protein U0Q22_14700 [Acidimicrobiales bacterium]
MRRRRRFGMTAAGLGAVGLLALAAGCSSGGRIETASTTGSTAASARSTTTASTTTVVGADSFLQEFPDGSGHVALWLMDGTTKVRSVYRGDTFSAYDDPARSPILDAELASDGTVYVVERTDRTEDALNRPGGTHLVRIDRAGAVSTVKANVTGSELSPDGTRMAVVILSPDGNGDGKGTQAIRVIDLATGATDTLRSNDVALDDSGQITQEISGVDIVGWTTDQSALIVEDGCCDSGSVTVVPAHSAGAGSPESWPTISGDHATYALGTDPGGKIIVQRSTFLGDGVNVPMQLDGIEIVTLDPDTGAVSAAKYEEHDGMNQSDRPRYDLVGTKIPGTTFPVAFETTATEDLPDGATAPRRFR